MKLYSVTQGIEVKNFMCDSISVLPSGQITLHRDNEIIAVFNKDTNVVSIEDEREKMNEYFKKQIEAFRKDMLSVDEHFFTDVFLQKNTIEEAQDKIRKILGKAIYHLEEFENYRI